MTNQPQGLALALAAMVSVGAGPNIIRRVEMPDFDTNWPAEQRLPRYRKPKKSKSVQARRKANKLARKQRKAKP